MASLKVVPCAQERIPEVVHILTNGMALDRARRGDLCDQIATLYFGHPWDDHRLRPLICEDAAGQAIGFLGVIPRPMRLDGRPVLAATCSNLRVRPGPQGRREPTIALRLLRTLFAGPQDLTFADGANDRSRLVWEACGGIAAPLYSLDWLLPLRPSGALLALEAAQVRLPHAGLLKALGRAADLVGAGALRRLVLGGTGPEESEPLLADYALATFAAPTRSRLHAAYDAASLAWLAGMAERKALPGSFRLRAVRDGREGRSGWFAYLQRRSGVADVLHMEAAPGRAGQVLGALARDAASQGIGFLRGAVDIRHLQAYRDLLCLMSAGRWTLVHARNPVIAGLFRCGDALLRGYDGERWILEFPESL